MYFLVSTAVNVPHNPSRSPCVVRFSRGILQKFPWTCLSSPREIIFIIPTKPRNTIKIHEFPRNSVEQLRESARSDIMCFVRDKTLEHYLQHDQHHINVSSPPPCAELNTEVKNHSWLQTKLCFRHEFPSNCDAYHFRASSQNAKPVCLQRKPPLVTS